MSLARQEYQGSMYIGDSVPPTANKPILVQLTAVSGGLYSWKQVYGFHPPGTFTILPGGLFGTAAAMPAINLNGFSITTFPTIALLQKLYLDSALNWIYVIISVGGNPSTGGGGGFTPTAGGAYVNDNGANTLNTGTLIQMQWAFPPVDDNSPGTVPSTFFNGTTSFIARSAGDYIFGSSLSFTQSGQALNGNEIVTMAVRLNSTAIAGDSAFPGFIPAGSQFSLCVSARRKLATNDVIDVEAFQTFGADPGNPSWFVQGSFWIERLEI